MSRVKNLDRYCIEVAIQSIANLKYTTYVVKSREEAFFVKEVHDHKQELRSSSELFANFHEPGRNEAGNVIRSHKETWAAPSTNETSADFVIFAPIASLFTTRTILMNDKKWIIINAHSRYGGHVAVSVSKMVTPMLRHFDQGERQLDGSRHWDSIKPVLMRAFAHQGARDFDDGSWLRLIHDGNTKKKA